MSEEFKVVVKDASVVINPKKHLKNIYRIFIVIILMFPLYLLLIGIWSVSSSVNKPIPPIDAVPKYDANGFFTRRADAICPANALDNFLDLECFLNN